MGTKIDLGFLSLCVCDRNLLDCRVGVKIDLIAVQGPGLTRFLCGCRKRLGFSVGIEIDLIVVWGVEIDFVVVFISKLTWFQRRDRILLDFSVRIERHLVLCAGRK